mgnify:FL=1
MIEANERNGTPVPVHVVGLYEFRSFGQSHAEALKTIGNMTSVEMSGTPTAGALLAAQERLSRRPEKRHVMFVLTDGGSDNPAHTNSVVRTIESCGVSVVGIGIHSTNVKNEFGTHVVVNDVMDLPAVMLGQVNQILLGSKKTKAVRGASARKKRQPA